MSNVQFHLGLDGIIGYREKLGSNSPSTASVATLASIAGVDGLSLDLRGPLKKAAERDARLVRASVESSLLLVMAPGPDLMDLAFEIRPNRVLIGPQLRDVGPESAGIDATLSKDVLKKQLLHLRDSEFEVGVIIEPEIGQVKTLHRLEAQICVLSVDGFVRARHGNEQSLEFNRLLDAANLAYSLGMKVGLRGAMELKHCHRLSEIGTVHEVHIGHSVIARSMLVGVSDAVQSFREQFSHGRMRG
jgi:pyridoxine 5-phosphate synthase